MAINVRQRSRKGEKKAHYWTVALAGTDPGGETERLRDVRVGRRRRGGGEERGGS